MREVEHDDEDLRTNAADSEKKGLVNIYYHLTHLVSLVVAHCFCFFFCFFFCCRCGRGSQDLRLWKS